MTSSSPAIRVSGLKKAYRKVQALAGVDFEAPSGKVTGFVGPNGAGKTTTFRALLGLTRPDAGSIEVLGLSVPDGLPEITKKVGAIIEEPGLIAPLSGRTNLEIAADTLGFGHDGIPGLLDLVGLATDAARKVSEYSKGMKQRLALAAALIGDPELLVLDEPLDGLDPAGQKVFRSRLRHLADGGTTVLVSSHDMADVEALADHIVVISRGSIITQGPLEGLLEGGGTRVVVTDTALAVRALSDAGVEARVEDGRVMVALEDRELIVKILGAAGIYPQEIVARRNTLESVFLEMTGEEAE